MWAQNEYLNEKLAELSRARPSAPPVAHKQPATLSLPTMKPLARRAGGVLRRIGEGLEAWASPPHSQHRPA
jgi:hypothetical protein